MTFIERRSQIFLKSVFGITTKGVGRFDLSELGQ